MKFLVGHKGEAQSRVALLEFGLKRTPFRAADDHLAFLHVRSLRHSAKWAASSRRTTYGVHPLFGASIHRAADADVSPMIGRRIEISRRDAVFSAGFNVASVIWA